MALRERGEQRGDLPRAENHRHVEPQQSARLDLVGRYRGIGGLHVGQNALGGFEIAAPALGDRKPPGRAVK